MRISKIEMYIGDRLDFPYSNLNIDIKEYYATVSVKVDLALVDSISVTRDIHDGVTGIELASDIAKSLNFRYDLFSDL